jgi:FixJ family two-component response regulator
MVHGIVVDLGGAIDIATDVGRGTSISVWLPLWGDLEAASPESGFSLPRGNSQVVMVVDDERPLVELAEELLAELGYEPVGFDTAERALEVFLVDPKRFDVVLTDEMLPGLTGTELAERLLAVRPGLPVLLVSGNVGSALEQRVRDVGIMALLRKPLRLQELADSLAQALSPPK